MKKETEKNYWICLNDPRQCAENNPAAVDLLGAADCELCAAYNNCNMCGRQKTSYCNKCHNRKEDGIYV